MAQLQPVPRASSPFNGREGPLAVVLGIALLAVIVKPWGTGEPEPSPYRAPSPSPIASAASSGADAALRVELFGPFEPTPEWSIWPAGYFTSIMYVTRAQSEPRASGTPAGGEASASPASSGAAPSSGSPLPAAAWPGTIEVGPGDHLLWLGIDTPRGWSVDSAVLRRQAVGKPDTEVPTRMLASPWPSHFSVLALGPMGDAGATRLQVWPAGDYTLELRVSPGDVRRILEIRIRTIPDPAPPVDRGGDQR
jgi:hypothetical protein